MDATTVTAIEIEYPLTFDDYRDALAAHRVASGVGTTVAKAVFVAALMLGAALCLTAAEFLPGAPAGGAPSQRLSYLVPRLIAGLGALGLPLAALVAYIWIFAIRPLRRVEWFKRGSILSVDLARGEHSRRFGTILLGVAAVVYFGRLPVVALVRHEFELSLLIGPFVALIGFSMVPLFAYGRIRRLYRADPELEMVRRMSFDENGLIEDRGPSRSQVAWTGIVVVLETESLYLLFNSTHSFCIVPKWALKNELRGSFADLLARQIQPPAGAFPVSAMTAAASLS